MMSLFSVASTGGIKLEPFAKTCGLDAISIVRSLSAEAARKVARLIGKDVSMSSFH